MQKHRHNTKGPSYLILHKTEWSRLKRQSGPPEEPSRQQKEYVQSLIEKSHEWTKTWPDHEHGVVANHEQRLKKKREDQISTVKAYLKNKKPARCKESINLARQKIFEESCYGVKLLSAFRESKTIEERDIQLKFKKQLKDKQESESKDITIDPYCTFGLDKYKSDEEKQQKIAAKQLALQNKEIYENQQDEIIKALKAQKQEDLEDLKLMTELLKVEEDTKTKYRHLDKEAIEQCIAEGKKFRQERATQEAEYDAKIEKCHNEKDKLQQKINFIFKKVNRKCDLPWTKKIFEAVELCQEQEKKRYNDFIENNERIGELRCIKREQKSKDKAKAGLQKAIFIADTNKTLAELEKQRRCTKVDKCACDRQSFLVKSHKDRVAKKNCEIDDKDKQPPNFKYHNTLTSALTIRMREPAPWTGAQSQHEEFSRNANKMLRDCKYKQAGRKVVDAYKKYNGLDTLNIPNYY